MIKKSLTILLILLSGVFAGCGGGEGENETTSIPIQHWKDMDVRIEAHPNPPHAGMSEMVVIITGPRGRPIHDLLVSLRADEKAQWVQAIQDGYIGVYRRSVDIGSGDTAMLQVRLLRGNEQKVLLIPLKLAAD